MDGVVEEVGDEEDGAEDDGLQEGLEDGVGHRAGASVMTGQGAGTHGGGVNYVGGCQLILLIYWLQRFKYGASDKNIF